MLAIPQSKNPKVMIIAYYFPPLGMGGVQRAVKFAKHLPQFNWSPVVVTVKNIVYYATDYTLLSELNDVKIYRSGSLDPQRLLFLLSKLRKCKNNQNQGARSRSREKHGWIESLTRWLFIPDAKILWLPIAIVCAVRAAKVENIHIVMTTSPPHSSHFIGLFLKIFFRLKWIADFRDQWTGGHLDHSPTIFHQFANRLLEKAILKKSDAVIAVTPRLCKSMVSKCTLASNKKKCIMIPNGYDTEDIPQQRPANMNKNKITFAYSGCVSQLANPEQFFKALHQFLEKNPDYQQNIKVIISGETVNINLLYLMHLYELNDVVEITGYLPHKEAMEVLNRADVLLLLLTGTGSRDVVPGKVYEYLAFCKPVLTLGPEGDMTKIIQESGIGIIADNNNIDAIERAITELVSQTVFSFKPTEKQKQYRRQFERRYLTGLLVEVLDDLNIRA